MAIILCVSQQGYYKWLHRVLSPYKHEYLLAMILKIRAEYQENENYGIGRILLKLQQKYEYKGSLRTIYRVCKDNNLLIKRKRNPNGITKADKEAQKSENIIKQDFTAEAPNEKWLSDVTEVACSDGKLYVSAVFDCYDGAIVGLSMDDNMRKELCISSFESACKRYNARGMIFHSDRGSQVRQEVA